MASGTREPTEKRIELHNDPLLPCLYLTLLAAVGVRVALLRLHATEEDFFITLRYAVNLAHGRGFVYNWGEPVLGTTTPLYTLYLALLIRLHLDPVLGGKILGIVGDVIACYSVYRLGRAIGRPSVGVAAALCLALFPTNLIWATKGMEVGIVAGVVGVAWSAWAERRELRAWIAVAVLMLLRIDGAMLALILLIATLVRDRRVPWRGLTVCIILILPWLVYATLRFGSPIPASLRAKLIVYGWRASTPFPRLIPFIRLMTHPTGLVTAIGCLFALLGLLVSVRNYAANRAGRTGTTNGEPENAGDPSASSATNTVTSPPGEWLLIAPTAWMLSYYAGMALSKVFLFGWYFVPPTPIYYLVAMTGWSLAWERLVAYVRPFTSRQRSFPATDLIGKPDEVIVANSVNYTARYMAITCVSALLLAAVTLRPVVHDLRATQSVEDEVRIPIGLWLREHARPTDTVMLEPIGYIGYYSGLRVLDTVALVSPEVLPMWRSEVVSPRHEMWTHFLPEWVLLRAGEWSALERDEAALPKTQRLGARYTLVHTWPEHPEHNVLPGFLLYRRRAEK